METETDPMTVDLGDWGPDNWGTVGDRITRGLAWLIRDGASFGLLGVDHIDLDELRMRNTTLCVLAQVGGDRYESVVQRIIGRSTYAVDCDAWQVAHGFSLPAFSNREDWDTLTNVWRRALTAHRVIATATDA